METLNLNALTFQYRGAVSPALDGVTLSVRKGEILTVCGQSGCGKTTLLRLLTPALSPNGVRGGEVTLDGAALSDLPAREAAGRIGFVGQNPAHRIVCETVWQELAFAAENLGMPSDEIRVRVAELSSFFGMEAWFRQKTDTLSGGQKQMLCLASAMVTNPELLLLDEPTATLDPIAAGEFLAAVKRLSEECSTTVILSEHRLEQVFPMSDRVLVLEEGRPVALGTPREVGKVLSEQNHPMSLALPAPQRVCGAMTASEGAAWLKEQTVDPSRIPADETPNGEVVILMDDVHFSYETEVLRGMDLAVGRGETFALLGGNAAGKSTALSLIAGGRKPGRGKIAVHGTVGYLPQDVQTLFSKDTVGEELVGYDVGEDLCRVAHLRDAHPYDLSGGEQERVALAKVLAKDPDVLLLDEPTHGMDAVFKAEFAKILRELRARGVTVLLVTHDLDFAAETATRCGLLFDGAVLAVAPPREFFAGKRFYTTAANRMARETLPRAVTAEDVLRACGREEVPPAPPKKEAKASSQPEEAKRRPPGAVSLLSLAAAALTLVLGLKYFGEKRYLLTGLLLALELTLPFLFAFEKRRPPAREVVTVSVLCALAIAGRAVFYALPQVKPALAVVIVTGVALGAESGVLVGALTALVSNFFFGQGLWTPWQMLAFALVGLLAGLLPQKTRKLPLCIFGFFAAFLYGAVMNPASVVIAYETPSVGHFLAAYVSGLPFDLIHAVSTAVFLWIFGVPLRRKLSRMRQKTVDFSAVK